MHSPYRIPRAPPIMHAEARHPTPATVVDRSVGFDPNLINRCAPLCVEAQCEKKLHQCGVTGCGARHQNVLLRAGLYFLSYGQ